MTGFSMDTDVRDGVARVILTGEFDLSVVPRVDDEIMRMEATGPTVLVLDLSALTFMDSSGLRVVVTADERARRDGRRFTVVNGPDAVRRVFEITKVDKVVEIVDDLSQVTAAG